MSHFSVEPYPAGGAEVIGKSLSLRSAGRRPSAPPVQTQKPGKPATIQVASPLPVHTPDARALFENRFLASAERTAWQYLVVDGATVLGAAEVVERLGGQVEYAGFYPAKYATRLIDAIASAERMTGDEQSQYTVRILRAPDLTFLSIWLFREDAHRLMPIEPFAACGGELVDEATLTAALIPIASRRKEEGAKRAMRASS